MAGAIAAGLWLKVWELAKFSSVYAQRIGKALEQGGWRESGEWLIVIKVPMNPPFQGGFLELLIQAATELWRHTVYLLMDGFASGGVAYDRCAKPCVKDRWGLCLYGKSSQTKVGWDAISQPTFED
jgi:hypothetical protein